MLTSDNVVLGHFSNRELAVFTGAQRQRPRKAMAVNGEKVSKEELLMTKLGYEKTQEEIDGPTN